MNVHAVVGSFTSPILESITHILPLLRFRSGPHERHNGGTDHKPTSPISLVSIIGLGVVKGPPVSGQGVQGGEVGGAVAGVVEVRRDAAISELNLVVWRGRVAGRPLLTIKCTKVKKCEDSDV